MKDVEILLRSFALSKNGDRYSSSMARFLDRFSKEAKSYSEEQISYLRNLFLSFVESTQNLRPEAFQGESGKFNIPLFEAVFAAVCRQPLQTKSLVEHSINPMLLNELRRDPEFLGASQKATTNKGNVDTRLRRANDILGRVQDSQPAI